MLNRRHIRIKVLQTIYAMHQSGSEDLDLNQKFLYQNIENIQDLYLLMLTALIEIRKKEAIFLEKSSKKHLASKEELNPNTKFADNTLLLSLENNTSVLRAIEDRKFDLWEQNDDYINLLWETVRKSDIYTEYLASPMRNFQHDKDFVVHIFSELIAPNDKLYDYLEDQKLSWVDDIPVVNTLILKQLKQCKNEDFSWEVPGVYKDFEDKDFAKELYRKTLLNEITFTKEFSDKTPNWDMERIAEVDTIILKMAICEFHKFPSIPVKVTINEYLEIAKEYSTPKSSIFINGILDNLIKEYQTKNILKKSGRGLM
ncbi:MAG: transcription antitermination factor NusB [Flavobacterium sp.]